MTSRDDVQGASGSTAIGLFTGLKAISIFGICLLLIYILFKSILKAIRARKVQKGVFRPLYIDLELMSDQDSGNAPISPDKLRVFRGKREVTEMEVSPMGPATPPPSTATSPQTAILSHNGKLTRLNYHPAPLSPDSQVTLSARRSSEREKMLRRHSRRHSRISTTPLASGGTLDLATAVQD